MDLDLEPDPPGTGTCGRCTRCMDRCPTGAIKAPGVVDARLCISYLTIENRGEIPRELREQVGDWAFGCDVCQEVCPYNKTKASRSRWPEFSAEEGHGPYLEIERVLGIRTEEEFEEMLRGNPPHAPRQGRPVAQLLRGRRKSEAGGSGSGLDRMPARATLRRSCAGTRRGRWARSGARKRRSERRRGRRRTRGAGKR